MKLCYSWQNNVEEAKYQMVAGVKYRLTINIYTTDCPEGSPSAEDETTCLLTHTQNCVVHVWARLESDGDRYEIVDPQPSCTAKGRLLGKMLLICIAYVSNYFLFKAS